MAGFTQQQLADRLGITREYVSMLEHGKRVPSTGVLYALVKELGVTPAALAVSRSKSIREVRRRGRLGAPTRPNPLATRYRR